MPRRSRHISHFLMIISGIFALLLIMAGIYTSRPKPFPNPLPTIDNSQPIDPGGRIAGVSTPEDAPTETPTETPIDTSEWKKYIDPVYHFTIQYPSEWATPIAKKISDPDFDYEYQVSFGTAETIAGQDFEGFSIYIFRTEKCNGAQASETNNASRCSTKKSSVATGASNTESITEFSSQAYTYTIVPFIPAANADTGLVKKSKLELKEAGKTFQYDTNLKVLTPPKPTQPKSVTAPSKSATPIGRRGKLTGSVSSGGRAVCPHPNRKPMRSPNKGNHVDEDCCPDPDEYPNIACFYKPSDYKIML